MIAVEEWQTGLLGDLCSIEIGGTPSRNNPAYWDSAKEAKNLWVSIRDLNKAVITDTNEYISALGVKNSNVKLQKAGTVLLSFKLTIGRVAFAGNDLFTNEAIAGLRSEELDAKFLYHGLQQWDLLQGVDQAIKGSTLNKAKLSRIKFKYPTSRKEQTQIAKILSTIDQAIEQTEAIIAKQQRIKTGLMQDLLTRGIDEHGNIRSEATHEFKDSPLGRIPVEWEVGGILDFASQVRQPILTGPFGAQLGSNDFVEEGIPVLRIGNVQAGFIDLEDLNYVSEKKAEGLSRWKIKAGDLLFARQGATTGRNALADSRCNGFLINYHIIRVAVDETKCDPRYLYAIFNSTAVQKQVDQEKGRGTREGVSTSTLTAFSIPFPPHDEQVRLADVIEKISKVVEKEKSVAEKLRSQKTGLMQGLLTGKVRVTQLLKQQAADS